MDTFKVTIDREAKSISVMNNGRGIPIEIHSKEQIYIPELIFGHLCVCQERPRCGVP
jgi:DNA topoisomerase-2